MEGYRVCDFCQYNTVHLSDVVMQSLARNKQKEELVRIFLPQWPLGSLGVEVL
jgi:hypothetical protein